MFSLKLYIKLLVRLNITSLSLFIFLLTCSTSELKYVLILSILQDTLVKNTPKFYLIWKTFIANLNKVKVVFVNGKCSLKRCL